MPLARRRAVDVPAADATMTIGLSDEEDYLGILIPKNGLNPKRCMYSYPEEGGLFVMDAISPIGAKWRDSRLTGPSSRSTILNNGIQGDLYIKFTAKEQ